MVGRPSASEPYTCDGAVLANAEVQKLTRLRLHKSVRCIKSLGFHMHDVLVH